MNRILVIGGAGFVGRHIVARLVGQGLRVTVPTRHRGLVALPELRLSTLQPLGLARAPRADRRHLDSEEAP